MTLLYTLGDQTLCLCCVVLCCHSLNIVSRAFYLVYETAQFGGMAAGPLLNTIIGHIDTEWRLWGGRISLPINPHNSVGLVMAGIDFAMLVFLYFFLPEPAPKPTEVTHDDDATNRNNTGTTNDEEKNTKLGWWDVFHAVPSYINLWLPIFCIICLNANYSLIETAFAPAAGTYYGNLKYPLPLIEMRTSISPELTPHLFSSSMSPV